PSTSACNPAAGRGVGGAANSRTAGSHRRTRRRGGGMRPGSPSYSAYRAPGSRPWTASRPTCTSSPTAHVPFRRRETQARRREEGSSSFERSEEIGAPEHTLELVAALRIVQELDASVRRVARHLLDPE